MIHHREAAHDSALTFFEEVLQAFNEAARDSGVIEHTYAAPGGRFVFASLAPSSSR
jgi:hypothetical protein